MSVQAFTLQPIGPSPYNQVAFDLAATTNRLIYDVSNISVVTVAAYFSVGTSSAVLVVERSLDGTNFYALETAQAFSFTNGLSAAIDCNGFKYLSVRPSTAESTRTVKVAVFGKASA